MVNHPDLETLLRRIEDDSSLLQPDKLRERLIALDELDFTCGGEPTPRAEALQLQLEAANTALYNAVRTNPDELLKLFQPESAPQPGLSFDFRDQLLSGVLQLREPGESTSPVSPEMVRYQTTPARHILQLIKALTPDDILVDLGSGLGHVPLLVSLLTDTPGIGIELQPAYVASARECAESLHLNRVQFIAQDVREADLSTGTVFYLYTPFNGSILTDVLGALRAESTHRPIKLCTLGPCTAVVANELWLEPTTPLNPAQVTIFHSR